MATYYWVGGSAQWFVSGNTHFATSSGGTAGTATPTAADNVIVDNNSGSPTITVGNGVVCKTLTSTATTCVFGGLGAMAVSGNVTFSSGTTFTGGVLTINATSTITVPNSLGCGVTFNSIGGTLTLASNLTTTSLFTLTNGTLNLANFTLTVGTFNSNVSNIRVIQFGTGNITTTNSGTMFFVSGSNLTYTGTPTVNISNNSATGSTITTSTGFTATNALNFNITTGTYALSVTSASVFKSLDFTGFTGSWAPGGTSETFYGSLTLVSGMTFTTGTATFSFLNTSGTAVITPAGKTLYSITQNGSGGTVQLAGALTTSLTYNLTQGTLDLNSFVLNTNAFNSSNTATRVIAFGSNGKITITGSGSTAFQMSTSTNYSYTGTGTISFTSTSPATFSGGGSSYPTLNLNGTGAVTVTGANTFANITNTTTGVRSLVLPASTTTTVNAFSLKGVLGSLVTITSSTALTQATMNLTTGKVTNSDYLVIQDSSVTPSTGTWYAGANSVNTSNNTGWIFANYVPSTGNFFLIF